MTQFEKCLAGVCSLLVLVVFAGACSKDTRELVPPSPTPPSGAIHYAREDRRVMILYSAAYNDLSTDLAEDISDMAGGYLPGNTREDNVLLVFSHQPSKPGVYNVPTSPVLFRLYSNGSEAVYDTLKVYPSSASSVDTLVFTDMLEFVREQFPARSYGLVLSSHSSGWVPFDYYQSGGSSMDFFATPDRRGLGMAFERVGSKTYYHEMDMRSFVRALPYRFEYILADMCLLGGVEFAYELKGKADYVSFSQTEVMSEGYDYKNIVEQLLGGREADCQAVCRSFFEYYQNNTSTPYATVSLINCNNLGTLAYVCRPLYEKYRTQIRSLDHLKVQEYYRMGKHWYYDFKDILVQAGITADEEKALDAALDSCIVYKGATERFISFDIKRFCGLSCYLPSFGDSWLDSYYRTLAWNKATSFVE